MGAVKGGVYRAQKPLQLFFVQGGGGAAADVNAADGDARTAHHFAGRLHFTQQGLYIGGDQMAKMGHIIADKGAIAALGRTEGNADIQLRLTGQQAFFRLPGGHSGGKAQLAAGFGHVILLLQPIQHLPGLHALVQGQAHRLGGLDAGEAAPHRLALQMGQQCLIQSGFHRVSPDALVFFGIGLGGGTDAGLVGGLAPQRHLRFGDEHAIFLPQQAQAVGLFPGLTEGMLFVGQQGDEHLLHAAATVVAGEIILHRFSPSST